MAPRAAHGTNAVDADLAAGEQGAVSVDEGEQDIREELSRRRAARERDQDELTDEERARLRALHWMRCPKCGLELQEVKLGNVDVDVCFACNGVFLDQGELEKIEKRSPQGVMSAIINWFRTETKKPV